MLYLATNSLSSSRYSQQ